VPLSGDEQRIKLGGSASIVWLVIGALLFLIDAGLCNLLAPKAAGFLLHGTVRQY
jgi:hypothetical protein